MFSDKKIPTRTKMPEWPWFWPFWRRSRRPEHRFQWFFTCSVCKLLVVPYIIVISESLQGLDGEIFSEHSAKRTSCRTDTSGKNTHTRTHAHAQTYTHHVSPIDDGDQNEWMIEVLSYREFHSKLQLWRHTTRINPWRIALCIDTDKLYYLYISQIN